MEPRTRDFVGASLLVLVLVVLVAWMVLAARPG